MLFDPLHALTLRTSAGLFLRGPPVARVMRRLADGGGVWTAVVAWSEIAGEAARVQEEDVRAALREFFTVREVLIRASSRLAAFGFSYRSTAEAQRALLVDALMDSWPVVIEEAGALVSAVRAAATPAPCVTEQALLWLIADALADPWEPPARRLEGLVAQRRFARLGMLASSAEEPGGPGGDVPRAPSTDLPTTMALLAPGRLVERDTTIRWVVRTVELYDELLGLTAEERAIFERAKGVDVRTWIVKLCSLATVLEGELASGRVRTTILPLQDAPDTISGRAVVAVVRSLARGYDEHRVAMRRARRNASSERLAFQSLRETPILDLGGGSYLVLHKDFLLAAADDGLWYALAAAAGRAFGSRFGRALESYVHRVLTRLFAAGGGRVAKVPASTTDLRCDFACRVGDDMFLVDSKRTGLNGAHLMGDADAETRILEELGHGCRQILSTARALAAGQLDDVLAELHAPAGWAPRRIVPLLVTHRPLFIVFSSGEHLVRAAALENEWSKTLRAMPNVWSLPDMELMEAAADVFDFHAFADAVEGGHPAALAGVPEYLTHVDYRGPVASRYFDDRRHDILAPFTDEGRVSEA